MASSPLYLSGKRVAIGAQWPLQGKRGSPPAPTWPLAAGACWCLLLRGPLNLWARRTGLLPRRFWYHHPISCRVPPAAPEAEDITEERGQSWSLLSLALTTNPANEEKKSWTLHQAQAFPSSISVCHRDRQHRVKQRRSKSSCGKPFQRINISIISQPDWKHSWAMRRWLLPQLLYLSQLL